MKKTFNTEGYCDPELHYMVDLSERLKSIKAMVDAGKYFAISRARQYGKTTTLHALAGYLQPQYLVISLDFQGLSFDDFKTEAQFAAAFTRQILLSTPNLSEEIRQDLTRYADGQLKNATLSQLFFP